MEIYTQVPDQVTRDALRRLSDLTRHLGDCHDTDTQQAHPGRLADALRREPCPDLRELAALRDPARES